MKKLALLAVVVLSFVASATATNKAENPFPTCNPCQYVK
jgi:hypothetical protein